MGSFYLRQKVFEFGFGEILHALFPSSEGNLDFYFVPCLEEFFEALELERKVVRPLPGTDLDPFGLWDPLLLLLELLLLLVSELVEADNAGNGRAGALRY